MAARMDRSVDPQMILVPYQPGRRRHRQLWLGGLLLLVALVFYAGGYWQGVRQNFHLRDQRATLGGQVNAMQKDLQQLQEERAVLKHGSTVERQASEQVRQDNIRLQNQVAELEKTVSLYQGILSPGNRERGLQVERFELLAAPGAGQFRFRLILTQVSDTRDATVTGNVRFNLLGQRDGKPRQIAFEQLAVTPAQAAGVPFSFRFFQDLTGDIRLPDGFVPEQVEVIVQPKGGKASKLERRFDWKVQEVASDVGQRKE